MAKAMRKTGSFLWQQLKELLLKTPVVRTTGCPVSWGGLSRQTLQGATCEGPGSEKQEVALPPCLRLAGISLSESKRTHTWGNSRKRQRITAEKSQWKMYKRTSQLHTASGLGRLLPPISNQKPSL
jgi:hypothetical protein